MIFYKIAERDPQLPAPKNARGRCKSQTYQVGRKYTLRRKVNMCSVGFHMCLVPEHCLDYYRWGGDKMLLQVEAGIDAPVYYCMDGVYFPITQEKYDRCLEMLSAGVDIPTRKFVTTKLKVLAAIDPPIVDNLRHHVFGSSMVSVGSYHVENSEGVSQGSLDVSGCKYVNWVSRVQNSRWVNNASDCVDCYYCTAVNRGQRLFGCFNSTQAENAIFCHHIPQSGFGGIFGEVVSREQFEEVWQHLMATTQFGLPFSWQSETWWDFVRSLPGYTEGTAYDLRNYF